MTVYEQLVQHFKIEQHGDSCPIEYDGKRFWVDPMEDGSFAVQERGDLAHYAKAANIMAASKKIIDWKSVRKIAVPC